MRGSVLIQLGEELFRPSRRMARAVFLPSGQYRIKAALGAAGGLSLGPVTQALLVCLWRRTFSMTISTLTAVRIIELFDRAV